MYSDLVPEEQAFLWLRSKKGSLLTPHLLWYLLCVMRTREVCTFGAAPACLNTSYLALLRIRGRGSCLLRPPLCGYFSSRQLSPSFKGSFLSFRKFHTEDCSVAPESVLPLFSLWLTRSSSAVSQTEHLQKVAD
ncbi:uncharacterized protein J5F26_001620 [Ciconia maguari]